jgi:hypothetical protein
MSPSSHSLLAGVFQTVRVYLGFIHIMTPDLSSDCLKTPQQAGLRPYLWLEGLIRVIIIVIFFSVVEELA